MEISRFLPLHRLLCLPFLSLALTSCNTTSVNDEFADFTPIIRDPQARQEEKAMKMFGNYDPSKKSAFEGKQFTFENEDAGVRREFKKKEYAGGEHPYFKLREKGYFSDKKAFRTKEAREGSETAPWQNQKDNWFDRTFSKKEASLSSQQVTRKDFRVPEGPAVLDQRNHYEKRDYPVQVIEQPDQEKKLSKGDLGSLLNF